jgi:hypothetical protein
MSVMSLGQTMSNKWSTPAGVPSTVPILQMVEGLLRFDVNVIVEVDPAVTVTEPVPASSSP